MLILTFSFLFHYNKRMNDLYCGQNVVLIGDIYHKEECSIWHNSVLRADTAPIELGNRVNIQDLVMIHAGDNCKVSIEDDVTIGHSCILHGCTIKEGTIIGMGSIIMNHSTVGAHCIVGAGSLITENKEFPDYSLIMGRPAKVIRKLTKEEIVHCLQNAQHYVELSKTSLQKISR